ncbi:hypothetical protein G6L00_16395 [Agrobacterium rhizogenes]|nr:hypothetical protein [Rhizobium rhizogenes]
MTVIPEITDPLGKHWDQPKDIRSAPMDGALVLLTRSQFNRLSEYSATLPSAVYPGKCWKRAEPGPAAPGSPKRRGPMRWLLVWYGEHATDSKLCTIERREIRIGRLKSPISPAIKGEG